MMKNGLNKHYHVDDSNNHYYDDCLGDTHGRQTPRKEEPTMKPETTERPESDSPRRDEEQTLAHVREALKGLQYGEISIVVQDGVVIQVERLERKRLQRRRNG